MSFNVGENIGPYRIIEKLGQGGMATVYKAYHASLDRYVAIKALHPAFNEDKSFASRFQREARVVAKLEHPHIVPVYDYAEHEARPYLVMKFIEGETLKARMDQGPLASEEISRIVEAVGSALAYAHKQGVLHRDIKPSNVLLANDGQIYLADFGLARMAQSGESTLSSDMIMGTPQYISPEQAMGKSDLDQRTDLYSFGVMLYEMVVGRVPFNADTPFSIIHDHIYSPLPMPRKVNPQVPESVERVLLKSLAKERADRFEEAGQLVTAFNEAWEQAGIPMQGTFVRVSQALRSTDNSEMPPQQPVAAAPVAVPAQGTAVTAENVKVAETVARSEKKRSPWVWVGAAVGILFCLSLVWFARSNRLMRARNEAPTASSLPIPTVTLIVNAPMPPAQPTQAGLDAETHLELALEAWQAQDLQRSMEEINQAVRLRADQNDFLIEAGTQLFDAGQYLGAILAYGHAAQNYREINQPLPPEVRDRLEQSFYFGVEMDDLPVYIPLDAIQNQDPPMALFAQSRYTFLRGDMEVAHRSLSELLRVQPQWPMAQLLNAEILLHDGKLSDARRILEGLNNAPRVPDWVKEQAGILLSKSQ